MKRKLHVLLLTLTFTLTFISLLSSLGFAQDPEMTTKLVEGAKKESQLRWYHVLDVEEGEKLSKQFQGKYPFAKVEPFRSGNESILNRILAEDQAKKHLFDVVSVVAMTIEVLKGKNIIAKHVPSGGKFYPEEFKDPQGYWVASHYQLNVMAYNTRLVTPKEVPRTYEDLLDPKWKGKIAMDSGPFYWFASILRMMGEEDGLKYMKKLSEQDIRFYGRLLAGQLVAAGECSITIPYFNSRVETLKAEGAPLEWAAIEPLVAEVNSPAISANAPHPNTARLFVDFLLSREGQETISSFYRLPARGDVDARVPRAKARGMKILPFDPGIADNYEKYVKLFRDILMKKQVK